MDNIDVKVVILLIKQSFAEIPELIRVRLQHGGSSFVDQGGRRVPWLDLLAEDELDLVGVLGLDDREDIVVDLQKS